MKSLSFQKSLSVALLSAATFAVTVPVFAQAAIAPELKDKATKACTDKAVEKGYQLKEVASVEPYDTTGDRVKVVLMLTKVADGTEARLTCGYSQKDGLAAFDGDTATASKEGGFPWWWLLLPILGIPLLFALLRGKEAPATTASTYTRTETTEAVVRANGEYLDIHSGPGTAYQVTGTLRNGQRVILSSRRDNNWAELETGGWVPLEYLDTTYRQV